jgi:hypothetical protein
MKIKFCYAFSLIILFSFNNKSNAQANQQLSNLTSPTAINQSLLPGTSHSKNLGSSANQWQFFYLYGRIYLNGELTMHAHGTDNFFIGPNAGNTNVTGTGNTGIGRGALTNISSGVSNTATGLHALVKNTNGSENTANGLGALYSNTDGIDNTAVGFQCLNLNNTGGLNIAAGAHALYNNTTGEQNTAVGYSALYSNKTGSFNTALGAGAGSSSGSLTNSMALGYSAQVGASNEVMIGNSAISVIGGKVGWSTFSDGRFKTNIKPNVPGLIFIKLLEPVTYNVDVSNYEKFLGESDSSINKLKDSYDAAEKKVHTGFIAQDVETAARKINYDFDGINHPQNDKDNYSIVYANFVPSLVAAVQELSKMNDAKEASIDTLKQILSAQQNQIDQLKQMIVASQSTANSQQLTAIFSTSISQNVPNPFSNSTTIRYSIPQQFSSAKIIITDANGNALRQFNLSNNKGSINVDASTFSSGTYQYSLYVDGRLIATKQMSISK